eukprot:2190590-Alexandrium_andersonii.AAC.1
MSASLVGSEMCIRDRSKAFEPTQTLPAVHPNMSFATHFGTIEPPTRAGRQAVLSDGSCVRARVVNSVALRACVVELGVAALVQVLRLWAKRKRAARRGMGARGVGRVAGWGGDGCPHRAMHPEVAARCHDEPLHRVVKCRGIGTKRQSARVCDAEPCAHKIPPAKQPRMRHSHIATSRSATAERQHSPRARRTLRARSLGRARPERRHNDTRSHPASSCMIALVKAAMPVPRPHPFPLSAHILAHANIHDSPK